MISKISISNIATYEAGTTIEPKPINFIYGGNGTGKTSLSRFLSGKYSNPISCIEWTNPDHEKIVVYNRDFIEQNFSEDKALPGIFTLGSESIEIQNSITNLKNERDKKKELKEKEIVSKEKIKIDLAQTTSTAKEKCWLIQAKYGGEFSEALIGFRGSKDAFFSKCRTMYESQNGEEGSVPTYEALLESYRAAYAKGAEAIDEYAKLDLSIVQNIDSFALLSKVITGKADTPIGTFIQFLNAGDWVKQGLTFSLQSNGKCPFCQRELPVDLADEIAAYFDEEYEKDCKSIAKYRQAYEETIDAIQQQISLILSNRYDFLQYDVLERISSQIEELLKRNIAVIQSKIDNPSKVVEIDTIEGMLTTANDTIEAYNVKIRENNAIILNQNKARTNCQNALWRFFVIQAEDLLTDYIKKSTGMERGIRQIEERIKDLDADILNYEGKINHLEAELTSVLPTVTAINKILYGFGFTGFSLAENKDKPGTYLIVRPDGTDASRTLSEGEHNFISFLYFYHLCFGSQTNTGITDDKILVIDDPISSLDSNVLFVIATLVKSIIQYCRKRENGIKQVFVLTHNIYFHKEVTYLGSRENFSPAEVSYYIIRKKTEKSTIIFFHDNPIKTSYEILWDELKNPNIASAKSVFNTMRRILEHYFQVIGGIKYEECINHFEGEDKLICKSLIAYINDGSHSIFDDLVVSFDESSLDNYLRVFKLIFEKLHHIDHYNMMMGIASD